MSFATYYTITFGVRVVAWLVLPATVMRWGYVVTTVKRQGLTNLDQIWITLIQIRQVAYQMAKSAFQSMEGGQKTGQEIGQKTKLLAI